MIDFNFPNLNDKQRQAVYKTDGPVLILAGAGSGKTTVLINRIAYLIGKKGAYPSQILAITFTNKAANELKTRLCDMLNSDGELVWASTFHSLCIRILRRDIEKLGYSSSFNIFDRPDQLTVVKECLKSLNLDDKMFPPKAILNNISRAKDELMTPDDFEKAFSGDFRLMKVAQVYKLYQERLKSYNSLDFDDIIMLTVKLFEQEPEVLNFYQNRFKYIMVDEYQDTNMAQYRLVSLLSGLYRNLCVVGDDDQSIYKFRGANIENILSFEKQYSDATVIKLEENYRSTQNILDAANNVIKNNMGRKGKNLWTGKGKGEKIKLIRAQNEHDEGQQISDVISDLTVNGGYVYSDMAVLYRTNAQSRVLENMLIRNAIPYKVLGGLRFFDRKEIKDIIAYMKLINNPSDNVSLKRIINEPKRKIGKKSVEDAEKLSAQQNISMFEVCERSSGNTKMFADMINKIKEKDLGVSSMIEEILDKTGYLQALIAENTVEAKTRIENIKELVTDAVEYEKTEEEEHTLAGYLEKISLIADVDNYDETQDVVVLMTLHSAKGLEFPVVFLSGMEEGLFPGYQSILSNDELEEERRLCYVGITRAKQRLYISYAFSRSIYGSTSYNQPSRFLAEIPSELTEGGTVVSTPSFDKVFREKTAEHHTVNLSEKRVNNNSFEYKTGQRVRHPKFGDGTVLKATAVGNDTHLEVMFDTVGTKNLMAAYARLKKI